MKNREYIIKPKFVLATNNKHKLEEIRYILKKIEILSLNDINLNIDIPEDYETLRENAIQKARFVFSLTKMNVLADDTGLEINALNGRPGVHSAIYAGYGCSFEDNINKVLNEMKYIENRNAVFRCVAVMIFDRTEYVFQGHIKGKIIKQAKGNLGFGYDPIFIPHGYNKTFAQMPPELKNNISHRAIAFKKLENLYNEDWVKKYS